MCDSLWIDAQIWESIVIRATNIFADVVGGFDPWQITGADTYIASPSYRSTAMPHIL